MSIKDKNNHGFTLIELIIVMAIIAILSAIIAPSISKMVHKKNIQQANYNAKLIYMEVQKALNEYQYINDSYIVDYMYTEYDSDTGKVNIKMTIAGCSPDPTLNKELALPDDVTKSSWYASCNNEKHFVDFVTWNQDYTLDSKSNLAGVTNVDVQKNKNANVSSKKDIIGFYPQ